CTQYTIQCSVVLLNKIYSMSGKPPRRGRCSQATKRGQAGSVSTVNSAGRGHGASPACGCRAHLSFFSSAGCVIEPQHAEELVEWITKPSSSSLSSVTQAQNSLPANAAAKVAYSIGSMSTESPNLFDHSVGYMLQEEVQRFEGSDDGTEVEEGVPKKDKKLAVMFPQLQHTVKFAPVTRREGMMRLLTLLGCLI
ncbi:hypothetical protein AB205_0066100, partial [Aquarana catesbeiana]